MWHICQIENELDGEKWALYDRCLEGRVKNKDWYNQPKRKVVSEAKQVITFWWKIMMQKCIYFFFGITWTDDSFTVTSEKCIEQVNKVNFDFMLTLMENQTINVHLKTPEARQAPFGSVLHIYSSESVENMPSVSYFKDLEKNCHLLFSQGWNACDEKMMFNSSWPAVRLYYSEPFALACSKTLSMLLMNAFEHKTQRCKKNAICLSVLQCLCSEIITTLTGIVYNIYITALWK